MEKDKELFCKDMGLDCDFLACGKTEEEVLRKAGRHAQAAHPTEASSRKFEDEARASIREGYCDYGEAETEETVSEECSECYEECFECADECCF